MTSVTWREPARPRTGALAPAAMAGGLTARPLMPLISAILYMQYSRN